MFLFYSLCLDVLCTISLNVVTLITIMYGFTPKDIDLAMHVLEVGTPALKEDCEIATGILA